MNARTQHNKQTPKSVLSCSLLCWLNKLNWRNSNNSNEKRIKIYLCSEYWLMFNVLFIQREFFSIKWNKNPFLTFLSVPICECKSSNKEHCLIHTFFSSLSRMIEEKKNNNDQTMRTRLRKVNHSESKKSILHSFPKLWISTFFLCYYPLFCCCLSMCMCCVVHQ